MVNSGRVARLASPLRQTRASSKTGPAPATSSRFRASFGRGPQPQGPPLPDAEMRDVFAAEGVQVDLHPGHRDQAGRLTSAGSRARRRSRGSPRSARRGGGGRAAGRRGCRDARSGSGRCAASWHEVAQAAPAPPGVPARPHALYPAHHARRHPARPGRTLTSPRALHAAGLLPAAEAAGGGGGGGPLQHRRHPGDGGADRPGRSRRPDRPPYIPTPAELLTAPARAGRPDRRRRPITPVKGVVHRYPDRALLKPLLAARSIAASASGARRWARGGAAGEAELDAAWPGSRRTPAVREVILTGGDPLMLSPPAAGGSSCRLAAMPHIECCASTAACPSPPRAGDGGAGGGAGDQKPTFLCSCMPTTPANSPPTAGAALARLRRAGWCCSARVCCCAASTTAPRRWRRCSAPCCAARIKPYYLHQLDPAPGTARFRRPVEEGRALLRACGAGSPASPGRPMCGNPGGGGKVPLGPALMGRGRGEVTDAGGIQTLRLLSGPRSPFRSHPASPRQSRTPVRVSHEDQANLMRPGMSSNSTASAGAC